MAPAGPPDVPQDGTFEYGLRRVGSPILANPNYEDILGPRVDRFFARFGIDKAETAVSAGDGLRVLESTLAGKRMQHYIVPPRSVVAYGKTHNNLREFAFLRDVLARNGLSPDVFNTGPVTPIPCRTAVGEYDGALRDAVRGGMASWLEQQGSVSKALMFQALAYVDAYINWTATYRAQADHLPVQLVVANDHSPVAVAASMVARAFGIPRLYLQHAEISPAFPELDFEISILRNEVSFDIYRQAGPIPGRVFVLCREPGRFAESRLRSAAAGKATIGIYLTAQVDWNGFRQTVARLSRNPFVKSCFVKPHPSHPLSRVETVAGVAMDVRTTIPDAPHVAIVANSSVVIELLHRGIPVFQLYEMDTIPDDYYGFSRQGIAPRIRAADLDGRFWSAYAIDAAWLSAYARYNPAVNGRSASDERELVAALKGFFRPGVQTGTDPDRPAQHDAMPERGDFVRYAVGSLQASVIAYLGKGPTRPAKLDEMDFVDAFEQLFTRRDPRVYDLFDAVRDEPVRSLFVFWLKRRDIEWTGRPTSEEELRGLLGFARTFTGSTTLRGKIEMQLLLLLIRLEQERLIGELLEAGHAIDFSRLSVSQRVAILKWLRADPRRLQSVRAPVDTLNENLPAFDRLRLRVLMATGEDFASAPWTHEQMEGEFRASASEGVRRDFDAFVRPCYEQLRGRLSYMDVRWNRRQRDSLLGTIEAALSARRPFSMVRLSDGEAYMFGGNYSFFTPEDARNRERHWWGVELPAGIREDLLSRLRDAARRADVLGIPSIYRFIRDQDARSTSLTHGITARGLLESLNAAARLSGSTATFSEEKCNLPLFRDVAGLKRMFTLARRVIVVGSVTRESLLGVFGDAGDIHYLRVPTHARTRSNDKYGDFEKPLPYTYPETMEALRAGAGPGDLVVVAAGVIGKIFIDEAKQRGAVALDVGSSLDEWVGAGVHSLH